MTRSDEAASFFIAVYNAVQEIPEGRVTSYGHIAKLVGTRTFVHVTKIVPSCQIPGPVTHILPFPCTQSIYLAITSHISFYVYTTPKTNSECLAYCKDGDKTAERPRQVGVCLKHLSHDAGARHNNGNVPWQRVINAKGIISPRSQPSGARNQATVLRSEGVIVSTDALGELSVDFAEYGWFPDALPSEEAGDEQDWNSENDDES